MVHLHEDILEIDLFDDLRGRYGVAGVRRRGISERQLLVRWRLLGGEPCGDVEADRARRWMVGGGPMAAVLSVFAVFTVAVAGVGCVHVGAPHDDVPDRVLLHELVVVGVKPHAVGMRVSADRVTASLRHLQILKAHEHALALRRQGGEPELEQLVLAKLGA